MKRITFLWALLLIGSGALFAKDAKTNGTTIGRVDRSNWEAIACSSVEVGDGGGMTTLYDGRHNGYWHTTHAVEPAPYWVMIDLGEGGAREFTAFQIYKRYWNNGGYQRNVQIYASDEPIELLENESLPADNGWILIGEGFHHDGGTNKMLTVETPGSADYQGRYLLFYFVDSYDNYIVVSEIYGIGEIADDSYAGTPYPDAPHAVPGVIEAEDFDRGGEGVSFHWDGADTRDDARPGYSNYRFDEEDARPVYIVDNSYDDGYHLGRNDVYGEWLNYTIEVAEEDIYDLSFRAGASDVVPNTNNERRFFQLLLDDLPLLADYDIIPTPKPENWDNGFYPVINSNWAMVNNVVERVRLPAGKHVLKVYSMFDFDKFTISKSYLGLPYYEENTLPAIFGEDPFILQAEDFDNGAEDMAYHVATPTTNTYRPNTTANIAEGPEDYHLVTGNGDWYIYTVNVPAGKSYKYVFTFYGQRAAASNYLVMEVNGEIDEELTAHIDFPISYDEPSEIYMPVELKEGKNVLKIKTNGGNLDKIEISKGLFDYQGGPFLGTPFIVSADQTLIISARDFDKGGAEISFHDTGAPNALSQTYRGEDAASQMEYRNGKNPDGSDNITISNSAAGEWFAYSIDVEETGEYDVLLTLATNNDSRVNHIEIDDVAYPEIGVRTTDWGTFQDFVAGNNIKITEGRHTLFVYYFGNFDKIKILKHKDASPYGNTPQIIPGIVEAWKFDEGSLGYSVATGDLGGAGNAIRKDVAVPIGGSEGGYYVDVVQPNTPQFLNYTVDIKEDGYYKITFKLRSNLSTIQVVGDNKEIIAEKFTLAPASNAWRPSVDSDKSRCWYASFVADPEAQGEWQEVVFPVMRLYKGTDTLKLSVGSGNISDIQYESLNFELLTDIIDRSNWSVLAYSGVNVNDIKQGAASGFNTDPYFAVMCTIDGDFSSFWHDDSGTFPHYIIYDLGVPTEITQLVSFRRQSYPDYVTVEWSGSNDMEDHENWPLLGVGSYSNEFQQNGELGLAVDLPQPAKVRYLKLAVPDRGYRGPYTNVLEVFARGTAFDVAPFNGPHIVPGIVQAEDFNTGGEGNAYHTSAPGTNTYRPDEAVNIAAGPEGGLHLVGATGDWYSYKIEVPDLDASIEGPDKFKDYYFEFAFYGEKAGADFLTVQINGLVIEGVTDNIAFPSAYDQPTVITPVKLRKGSNSITIKFNGGNLDKFEVRSAGYQGTPFFGTAVVVPGKVEVEDFDLGGEGIAFHDTGAVFNDLWQGYRPEPDGGPYFEDFGIGSISIGSFGIGEWVAYTVEFSANGVYDFTLRAANDNNDRDAYISIDNGPFHAVNIRTTAWGDFKDFVIEGIEVSAGIHQIYLATSAANNFDYILISKNGTGINQLPAMLGKVYTEGNILKVKDFPTTASLVVYNLLGQKIANYKTVNNGVDVNLPSKGIYIVKIQNEGITATYKVIAK
jgi:hypothetical protein